MKKNHTSDKPRLIEILFAIVAFLCYLGTIYFIVTDNRLYLIVFFVLHSCLYIVSLFMVHDRTMENALHKSDTSASRFEEEKQMFDTYSSQIASLKEERESLLVEKEQLTDKYRSATNRISQLEASLEEAKNSPADTQENSSLDHLLPQDENPIDLNIIDCARKVMKEMEPFSRNSGIQLRLSSAAESLMVRADASFMRILFRNIIDNSIKYMNRNGSLVITISSIGTDLFIVLKDNGQGLPTGETSHIFELNYQGSNRISGNGLGLAQAKAIVEYYGGTIYAKSDSGKGMAIYIQLPATFPSGT